MRKTQLAFVQWQILLQVQNRANLSFVIPVGSIV